MRIINKYISQVVISAVCLILVILCGIETFLELASGLKEVGRGNFHFLQAILMVPLLLPTDIYELFPMAVLIGSLMGLGRLANQSELIVMSAAGFSRWQLVSALLQAALFLLLFVSVIGEGIAPWAQHYAKQFETSAFSGGQSLKTASGVWFRDGNNFIFIRDILVGNQLSDITRYKFDNQQKLILAAHARQGLYEEGHWNFHQVNESEILENHIVSKSVPLQQWDIHLDKRLLGVSNISPNQMSLVKLYKYISYRHQNDLSTGLYEFEFWKRLIQPFASLVMVFLAVPFIFGPLRTVSMGLRIVTGVIIGFSFYILNQFFGPISQVYQVPAFLAAILPSIAFAILGVFLLCLKT